MATSGSRLSGTLGSDFSHAGVGASRAAGPTWASEFAQRVCETPDNSADQHFRSQYSLLCHKGKFLPSWVGRCERFENDWRELARKAGFEPEPVLSIRECRSEDYRSRYTESLAGQVGERYAKDIEMWDYCF